VKPAAKQPSSDAMVKLKGKVSAFNPLGTGGRVKVEIDFPATAFRAEGEPRPPTYGEVVDVVLEERNGELVVLGMDGESR